MPIHTHARDRATVKPFAALEAIEYGYPNTPYVLDPAPSIDVTDRSLLVIESAHAMSDPAWRALWQGHAGCFWEHAGRQRAALMLMDSSFYDAALTWAQSKALVHALERVEIPKQGARRQPGRWFSIQPPAPLPEAS